MINQTRRAPLALLPFLGLAALSAGCGQTPPSPDDIAKISGGALGIPVMLWAQPDDYCVAQQLNALYHEYMKTPKAAQDQLVRKFKSYSAIVIQASTDAGTVTGNHYTVNLDQRVCRYMIMPNDPSYGPGAWNSSPTHDELDCEIETVKTAQVGAPRVVSSGAVLGTKVDKQAQPSGGPILYVTPTSAKDASRAKTLVTSDAQTFYAMTTGDGAVTAIESSVLSKSVTVKTSTPAPQIACGKLVSFSDL